MNEIIMRHIFIFFLLSYSSVAAQTPLTGTWNIDWQATRSAMTMAENQKFSGMSSAMQTKVQQGFENRSYIFNTDGQFTASWQTGGQQKQVQGTWSVINTRVTIDAQGQTKQYDYSISGNQLTLTEVLSGTGGLFSTLILSRAN
ncbi:hypothetical protein WSM22_38520 [Cytophagales bacterium WSM2-2]|nr:hypothetical protein WSM22_38520 [Cytophagales bacterium WSM2-2]